jgi:hypothetical protein
MTARQVSLDPETVLAIVLGGGAGTRLMPLTARWAGIINNIKY